jgi:AAA family ATP:ADP antiporter
VSQAKRFYPLLAVLGNLAPIASGKVMSYIISKQKSNDDVGFGSTLKSLAFIKICSCVLIIALYNVVYAETKKVKKMETAEALINRVKQVQKGELQITQIQFKTGKKNIEKKADNSIVNKTKPTLRESLIELSKSKELQSMAMMVLSYNVCIELTEVLWKGILRKSFPNNSDYMNYMASFSQKVGIIALVMQLSASFIISRLGWVWASRLTPLSMIFLAVPFFISVSMATKYNSIPISLALAIGTWQNVVNKVTKYSIFDPLKEMAYIPLGEEAKIKGKAAIDVMGARFGRCVAAASQQVLVLFGGSILNCSPQLAIIYMGIISLWIRAISVLGRKFESYEHGINNDGTKEELAKFGNLTLKTRRK